MMRDLQPTTRDISKYSLFVGKFMEAECRRLAFKYAQQWADRCRPRLIELFRRLLASILIFLRLESGDGLPPGSSH